MPVRDIGCTVVALGMFAFNAFVLWFATLVLSPRPLRRFTGWLTSLPLVLNPFLHIRPVLRVGRYPGVGRVIIMSTHHSNIDPFLLVGIARKLLDVGRLVVLFNRKLGEVPIFGRCLRHMDWIPVDFRSAAQQETGVVPKSAARTKRAAETALEAGDSLVVFPVRWHHYHPYAPRSRHRAPPLPRWCATSR